MFAGLFVVVAAAEKILLTRDLIGTVQAFHFANSYVLTFDTAVLSNVMSATLAGNLTPVGSLANLIVAERARSAGIHVSL
jgi:Na+/H+ antiporter NhaD/arsenite permease-like protein